MLAAGALALILITVGDAAPYPRHFDDTNSVCAVDASQRQTRPAALLSRLLVVNRTTLDLVGSTDGADLSMVSQVPSHGLEPGDPEEVVNATIDMVVSKFKTVEADLRYLKSLFLPGLSVPHGGVSALVSVGVALIWFWVYFTRLYTTDREDNMARWVKITNKHQFTSTKSEDEEVRVDFAADLIIVLRSNNSGSASVAASSTEEVAEPVLPASPCSRDAARRIFLEDAANENILPRVRDKLWSESQPLCDNDEDNGDGEPGLALGRATGTATVGLSLFEALGLTDTFDGPSKASIRSALLQDLTESLPKLGFEVQISSSVDGTQRIIHVALKDSGAIAKYLTMYNVKLQLQQSVLGGLGISQPPGEPESSPPAVRYDRRIVESLHASGAVSTCAPEAVYRSYKTTGSDYSIVPQPDRFRIIYKEIADRMDIEAAKEEGLIQDIFPAHDEGRLKFLRAAWLDFSQACDLGFHQPMYAIRGYFGSQVAFSFLLIGFYGKMLLALVAPAVIYEVAILSMSEDREELVGQETRHMLGFSIILVVWARLAANLWDREQSFFITLWNLDSTGRDMGVVREQFKGEYLPSPVDANVREKQCRAERTFLWRCVAQGIATSCCILLVIVIFVERILMSTNVYISSYLAAQMLVFEYAYDYLAGILTNWENHKTHAEHYNSLLWKQAIFQSVNHYYPFLHLVIQQSIQKRQNCYGMLWRAWSEQAGDRGGGDCLSMLRAQISTTLFFLSTFRIFQAGLGCFKVKFLHWMRKYNVKKDARSHGMEGIDSRPFVERQIDYAEFAEHQLVWMMLHPVLSLGHVLLFGAAAPWVVLMCFVVFMVNLRASAFLIAHYTQRPLPIDTMGIGEWREVVHLLMKLGVVCTAFLLVTYGESFNGTPLITRITGFLLFLFLTWCIHVIVELVVPQVDRGSQLLAARRHHVERAVMRACSGRS